MELDEYQRADVLEHLMMMQRVLYPYKDLRGIYERIMTRAIWLDEKVF